MQPAKAELIGQSMVEKNGPIPFEVKGLGNFKLVSLSQDTKPGKECHVVMSALGERLVSGFRTGEIGLSPGKSASIGLALMSCLAEGVEERCC